MYTCVLWNGAWTSRSIFVSFCFIFQFSIFGLISPEPFKQSKSFGSIGGPFRLSKNRFCLRECRSQGLPVLPPTALLSCPILTAPRVLLDLKKNLFVITGPFSDFQKISSGLPGPCHSFRKYYFGLLGPFGTPKFMLGSGPFHISPRSSPLPLFQEPRCTWKSSDDP